MIGFGPAHLPGLTPRPDPALFAPARAALRGQDRADLASSASFHLGFEAFDAGYFWESHEFWEPVWMALPEGGAERELLRGLIQLANCGLKRRMGRDRAAARILALADAALARAFGRGDSLMGLRRERVEVMRAWAWECAENRQNIA